MLSEAKHLYVVKRILRCAQNDTCFRFFVKAMPFLRMTRGEVLRMKEGGMTNYLRTVPKRKKRRENGA